MYSLHLPQLLPSVPSSAMAVTLSVRSYLDVTLSPPYSAAYSRDTHPLSLPPLHLSPLLVISHVAPLCAHRPRLCPTVMMYSHLQTRPTRTGLDTILVDLG